MDKEAHEQRNGMDRHGQGQCPGSVWASAEKKSPQILSSSRMSSVDEKTALRQKEHNRDRVKGRMQCWQ